MGLSAFGRQHNVMKSNLSPSLKRKVYYQSILPNIWIRNRESTGALEPRLQSAKRGKIKRNASNNTRRERSERGDLITIYKLMNNLEETDRKDLILRRK